MPFLYILQNKKGKYYIGSTVDLDKRIYQHSMGHTHSTHRLGDLKLVFSQEYSLLKEARSVELKLKRLKRHDYIASIVRDGFVKIKP